MMSRNRIEIGIGATGANVLSSFMANRSARYSMIMGPLGSGKTYGCVQRVLAHAIEQAPNDRKERPTRWCVVRNTYPDLMSTTLKDFLEVFTEPEMGRMVKGSMEPPTFHGNFKLEDGTTCKPEIVFIALDREQHIKKLRGMQATGFWFNEVKELLKSVVDMADARIGRYPTTIAGGVACSWHGVLADTNACDTDHWYYRLAEEERPEGWMWFRQPGGVAKTDRTDARGRIVWATNPAAENLFNLPPNYYGNLLPAKDDDWISVNLANEYGFHVDGKPVHPEYVDSVHCLNELPELDIKELRIGIDFGRTPAAALIVYDPLFGRHLVIDEFVVEDMSAALFGPELKLYIERKYPGAAVRAWGDPAGVARGEATEHTPLDVIRAAGIPIQAAPTQLPELRRAAIARPLRENCMDGRPRLLIYGPGAPIIRKGLQGGFCYRRMAIAGQERFTDTPDKNMYSHPVEALEYGLLGAGEYHQALSLPQPRVRRGMTRQRYARTS